MPFNADLRDPGVAFNGALTNTDVIPPGSTGAHPERPQDLPAIRMFGDNLSVSRSPTDYSLNGLVRRERATPKSVCVSPNKGVFQGYTSNADVDFTLIMPYVPAAFGTLFPSHPGLQFQQVWLFDETGSTHTVPPVIGPTSLYTEASRLPTQGISHSASYSGDLSYRYTNATDQMVTGSDNNFLNFGTGSFVMYGVFSLSGTSTNSEAVSKLGTTPFPGYYLRFVTNGATKNLQFNMSNGVSLVTVENSGYDLYTLDGKIFPALVYYHSGSNQAFLMDLDGGELVSAVDGNFDSTAAARFSVGSPREVGTAVPGFRVHYLAFASGSVADVIATNYGVEYMYTAMGWDDLL